MFSLLTFFEWVIRSHETCLIIDYSIMLSIYICKMFMINWFHLLNVDNSRSLRWCICILMFRDDPLGNFFVVITCLNERYYSADLLCAG